MNTNTNVNAENVVINDQPYNQVMQITPSMAARWLEGNAHNRKLSDAYVEQLARDMKEGRWQVTHQGIAFCRSGVLLDGQHRLWAIVLSGVTIAMRVFFNEPPEHLIQIDTGLGRSHADIMTLGGKLGRVSVAHLATLRSMVCGLGAYRRLTVGEETELYRRHHHAIDFALGNLEPRGRIKGVSSGPTRAVVARAYYTGLHARVRRFCEVLRTGLGAGPEEGVIAMLVGALAGESGGRTNRLSQRQRYAKTERALWAYLHDEIPGRLYAATEELFPLPEERGPLPEEKPTAPAA